MIAFQYSVTLQLMNRYTADALHLKPCKIKDVKFLRLMLNESHNLQYRSIAEYRLHVQRLIVKDRWTLLQYCFNYHSGKNETSDTWLCVRQETNCVHKSAWLHFVVQLQQWWNHSPCIRRVQVDCLCLFQSHRVCVPLCKQAGVQQEWMSRCRF